MKQYTFWWIYFIHILLILTVQTSCSKQTTIDQYFSYLSNPSNGLHKIQKTQWFEYQLQYQTAEALAIQALGNSNIQQDSFLKKQQDFLEHRYFVLSVKPNKSTQNTEEALTEATRDPAAGKEFFQVLQYGLQPFVKLSSGADTIPCTLYHAEPPLFKNGALRINLVFLKEPHPNTNQDLTLSIHIPDFPDDIPTFSIKRSDLTQIPTLKF